MSTIGEILREQRKHWKPQFLFQPNRFAYDALEKIAWLLCIQCNIRQKSRREKKRCLLEITQKPNERIMKFHWS